MLRDNRATTGIKAINPATIVIKETANEVLKK
jgi:hypothetical protein